MSHVAPSGPRAAIAAAVPALTATPTPGRLAAAYRGVAVVEDRPGQSRPLLGAAPRPRTAASSGQSMPASRNAADADVAPGPRRPRRGRRRRRPRTVRDRLRLARRRRRCRRSPTAPAPTTSPEAQARERHGLAVPGVDAQVDRIAQGRRTGATRAAAPAATAPGPRPSRRRATRRRSATARAGCATMARTASSRVPSQPAFAASIWYSASCCVMPQHRVRQRLLLLGVEALGVDRAPDLDDDRLVEAGQHAAGVGDVERQPRAACRCRRR